MPCGRKRPRTATDLEGTQWEDAPLGELARAITAEVASLQRLGASVIGGEVSTGQHDSGSSVRAGWEHCPESKAPCSGLRSRAERLGLERGPRFSLANVAAQLTEATVHAAPRLDLPNFSKMQRQQVAALAALHGYEARACGRRGLTLFRCERAPPAPLPPDAQEKAEQLVAQSAAGGRPSAELRAAMAAARGTGAGVKAALARPLAPDSRGGRLLQSLGWQAGAGLGRDAQCRTEPVPLHLGQGRRGLGS